MSQLKVGHRVAQGDWVGRVGDSGTCSRGAHLHITISKKSDPRYAKTFDIEKFIDQKIKKQEKAKQIKLTPLEKLSRAGVKIGTIWTWAKSKLD
jgi:murein DD-endopeptidase MepM/ murein hydrolase activator NlpD